MGQPGLLVQSTLSAPQLDGRAASMVSPMFRATHFFHFLSRLVLLALIMALVIAGLAFVGSQGWGAIATIVWIFAAAGIGIALDNLFLTPLAHLLYLRLRRDTPVNFAQAQRYTPLLTGPQWYPMKELNGLSPEQRLPFLEQMYARNGR
jgi:hypothetical protein